MKFRQKILVYSLTLFLIAFNIGAYFLIENSYNLNLKREIDRSISEQSSIYSGIASSATSIKNIIKYSFDRKLIRLLIEDYIRNINNEKVYIEILDNKNNEIFSNINFNIKEKRVELEKLSLDKKSYIIRDVGSKTYIFITCLLESDKEYYKFTYIRDISYLYENRKKQYYFFIKLDIIISIILSLGMYVLSRYITKPINDLIYSTKRIKRGNFSERVNINSNDEIGILSENFNEMADVIEEKILELKKSVNQKQRFINDLTHELKTPLTSIIGYADFLLSTKYNEKNFFLGLNYILSEGKRLKNLSEKMMDLILFKKENFIMVKENIKDILLEIKEVLNPKLESKNIDLIISGNEYEVLVEKDLIKNLIMNLIDNAIKASYENSKIYLNIFEDNDSNKILEIKDEGIGISKEDLAKIFEPFYMVDKSRTKANNGAGLGLSICSEIVKIHKAKMEIESELGKGTNMRIIFN